MITIKEDDLELAHRLEERLDRDDEREHVAARGLKRRRKPRYSRFATLSGLMERLAASYEPPAADRMPHKEAA